MLLLQLQLSRVDVVVATPASRAVFPGVTATATAPRQADADDAVDPADPATDTAPPGATATATSFKKLAPKTTNKFSTNYPFDRLLRLMTTYNPLFRIKEDKVNMPKGIFFQRSIT